MRIPYLTPNEQNDEQKELYEAILGGKRAEGAGGKTAENATRMRLLSADDGLIGPFNAWLFSPDVGQQVQQLGEALRFRNSLPNYLLEVAILVTARKWRALFEWWAHAGLARRAGVDETIIEAIRQGNEPEFSDPDQRLIYDFSRELLEERGVSDEVYQQAKQQLGERGVVDLVSLLGYYGLVSMTLNVFQVPLPEGVSDPFDSG